MPLSFDPEVASALLPIREAVGALPPLAVGDVQGRRDRIDAGFTARSEIVGVPQDIDVEAITVTTDDGFDMPVRIYRPQGARPSSGIVYLHGGGMICCSLDTHDAVCRRYAAAAGITVVAPGYRSAPEFPDPTPVEDCATGVEWTLANAELLGLDPSRIGIAGDSGGGGLAAGTTLLLRDRRGPMPVAQILLCPMLDDRNVEPDPELAPFVSWNYDDNVTGWTALLGTQRGTESVSLYAAPARATDHTGLPPTYIEVGGLDIFRDECIAYAAALSKAGINVELHVHPGATHVFELYAPEADVSRRAVDDRLSVMRAL